MSDPSALRWYETHREFTWQPYRIRPLAVWAMRMNSAFEIKTLAGVWAGKAGDWLVRADDGEQFPVTDENFRRFYARREWKGARHEKQVPDAAHPKVELAKTNEHAG